MKRIIAAAIFLIAGASASMAACPAGLAVMKDNAGTTFNMELGSGADGNCYSVNGGPDALQTFSIGSSTGSTALPLIGTQGAQFNLTSVGSGTVTAQTSNDNTNWVNAPIISVGSTPAWVAPATGVTTTGNYIIAIPNGARYVRVNVAWVSGTFAGNITATSQAAATYGDYVNYLAITSALPAGSNWIGATDIVVTPSTNFTRPANTTAYVAGQLVANSVTAGSVTPLSWTFARVNGGNGYVRRFRMTLSSKSITNTSFRLHLYSVLPSVTNGDGGTFLSTEANEICTMTTQAQTADPFNWQAGSDVSIGYGTPSQGNECNFVAGGGTTTLYGLVEARASYTPASAEVITIIPEVHQN